MTATQERLNARGEVVGPRPTNQKEIDMQNIHVNTEGLTETQRDELRDATASRTSFLRGMNVADLRSIIQSDYTGQIKLGQKKDELIVAILQSDIKRWVREFDNENADALAQEAGYENRSAQWATERRLTRLREMAAVDVQAMAIAAIEKHGIKHLLDWGTCAEEIASKDLARDVLGTFDALMAGSDERKPVTDPSEALSMAINSVVVHPLLNDYFRNNSTSPWSNAMKGTYREAASNIATRLY